MRTPIADDTSPDAPIAADATVGGYRIEFLGPHRWRLARGGREVSVHATASEARAAARRLVSRRRYGRQAIMHLIVVTLGLAVLVVAQPLRDIENPAAPRARAFADRLDAGYAAIRAGDAAPGDFTVAADGFTGGVVTFDQPGVGNLGGDSASVERYVLAGVFEGECYVVRWPPAGPVTTGVLAEDLPCEPGMPAVRPDSFVRASTATMAGLPVWEGVLPPETTRARWYLPAVIAAALLMLDGVVGGSIALIRRSRGG